MNLSKKTFFEIAKVSHVTSTRGRGWSLKDALARTNYKENRKCISLEKLIELVRHNPDVVEQWAVYSKDKITSEGFFIDGNVIGSCSSSKVKHAYDSPLKATAEYVLIELDFWAEVD